MESAPTIRDYYDDSYKFSSTGTLLKAEQLENEDWSLLLDRTIFHPQGGGQPSDEGKIRSEDAVFNVTSMKTEGDQILHIGKFESGSFEEGKELDLQVDEESRRIHARVHSAGHLLDLCMKRLDRGDLRPGKGYHFAKGAYVEYIGVVPAEERE